MPEEQGVDIVALTGTVAAKMEMSGGLMAHTTLNQTYKSA